MRTTHFVLVTFGLCLALTARGAAQQPSDPQPLTELLREVQALRIELRTIAIKTLQAQSVTTQLQIADQRITALRRDLLEISNQRAILRQGRTLMKTQATQMANNLPSPQREEFLKAQEDVYRVRDKELADREKDLAGQLSQEQARSIQFDGELTSLLN